MQKIHIEKVLYQVDDRTRIFINHDVMNPRDNLDSTPMFYGQDVLAPPPQWWEKESWNDHQDKGGRCPYW